MRTSTTTQQRGVTLVELLTIMAIAAVLLALAAPSFSEQLARRRLEGVASELSTDLQYARGQAVSENQPATLAVVSGAGGYTITQGTTTLKTRDLPGGVTLSAAPSSVLTVTFDPVRGTATVTNFGVAIASLGTSANLQLRTNQMGRVQLCSDGASLAGYKSCGG